MIKIAICDDEKYFRERLKQICSGYLDQTGYDFAIDCFESGEDFLEKSIPQFDYSIVFLDVSMREIDGIETARTVRKLFPNTYIVFVTAYITYALEGYKVNAVRFLLKDDHNMEQTVKECFDTILANMNYREIKQRFSFQCGTVELAVDRILYIESRLHKVFFHVMRETPTEYCMYEKLDTMEEMLGPFGFYRAHQSYLVNLNYVKSVERYNAVLINGEQIGISKKKYREFYEQYVKMRCDI